MDPPPFHRYSAMVLRKTKIIATLGPASDSPELLRRLLQAGVDVFRLNMSHASHDWVRRVVADIRHQSASLGRVAGILLDTQGPAIRTGDLEQPLTLKSGDRIHLTVRNAALPGVRSTSVNYDGFVDDVRVGDSIVMDNGTFRLQIVAKGPNHVECEALHDAVLGSRRHINLPGVRISLPALTDKDRSDVALGLELRVDMIAQSFVRDPGDVEDLRGLCRKAASPPFLVAKIEHQLAVNQLDSIARAADAVMVARGDLGIECPYAELPIIQRRIVKKCHSVGRPVIVATQMLESMIENPLPTRAEITDVANAVYEQADAIMLSGETTMGKHPLACIEVMDNIARRIERSGGAGYESAVETGAPRPKLVRNAVQLAEDLRSPAIIVLTRRGTLARYAAWMRPRCCPVFAFTQDPAVAGGLTLCRSVHPVIAPFALDDREQATQLAIRHLRGLGRIHQGDTVVVIAGAGGDDHSVDDIRLRHVG